MNHTSRPFALITLAVAGLVLVACSETADTSPVATVPSQGSAAVVTVIESATTEAVANYEFPTGPAVLVASGYKPPKDHVPSTGAYLPANGKPTLVLVDAIWCPSCALTRPIFHDLREEFQDEVNIVVLDYDLGPDGDLATVLGIRAHPGWAVIAPDSDEVLERKFGPLHEAALRQWFAQIIAGTAGDGA